MDEVPEQEDLDGKLRKITTSKTAGTTKVQERRNIEFAQYVDTAPWQVLVRRLDPFWVVRTSKCLLLEVVFSSFLFSFFLLLLFSVYFYPTPKLSFQLLVFSFCDHPS